MHCVIKHPFRWIAVFLYYGAVLFLLLSPSGYYEPLAFPFADKLTHAFLFLILGALLQHAALCTGRTLRWGIILAGTSELLQLFTPDRTADPLDFITDVVGIIIGAIFLRYVQKKSLQKKRCIL